MNTHENYVSLEIAKLLKEAGFDWKVNHYYLTQNDKTEVKSDFRHSAQNYNESMATMDSKSFEFEICSCPTLAVAQKWLREVKGCYLIVDILENKRIVMNSDGWTFHYEYDKLKFDCEVRGERGETINTLYYDPFDTYEEAQEAGIKKVLEIILKKGE